MDYTINEIRTIVNIARKHPELNAEDIAESVVEGYTMKNKLHAMIANFSSLFVDKPLIARPTTAEILEKICKIRLVPGEFVKGKTRKREIVRVRQQYCLIAVLFRYTQQTIGEEINRDHVTARHNKIEALKFYKAEDEYRDEVNKIIGKFPTHKKLLMDRLINLIK